MCACTIIIISSSCKRVTAQSAVAQSIYLNNVVVEFTRFAVGRSVGRLFSIPNKKSKSKKKQKQNKDIVNQSGDVAEMTNNNRRRENRNNLCVYMQNDPKKAKKIK